jgi:hypothetical protein
MKKNNLIIVCVLIMFGAWLTGCLKKIDILQSNTANVIFANSGSKFITSDVTVNPKDSIFFDFTITSAADMKYVGIQINPLNNSTFVVKDTLIAANKNSYSAVKKLAADSAAGIYKYRVVALDAAGVYIGSSDITVTVTADFTFYSARVLQVPDSTAKTNKCFFSTTNATGQTFSYSDGAANSASIDFGYFYDTTKVLAGSPAVLTDKGHTIYALNAGVPFAPYDLSSWTKNATLLKLTTTVTFASLTSSGALRTAGIAALTSGAVTRVSTTDRATASQSSHLTGAVILFKTVAGKYGAISVNYTNHNGAVHDSFINIDVKVQK